jgi:hypothetical protein
MARANIGTELTFGGDDVSLIFGETPPEGLRRILRERSREANRVMKKKQLQVLKKRVGRGKHQDGTRYNQDYAEYKSKLTGRSYSASGPVDLYKTGKLYNSLVGRGRPKPAKGILQSWIGFKRQSRSDSDLTNREIARILNGDSVPESDPKAKVGAEGKPFDLSPREREKVFNATVRQLLKQS